MKFSKDLHEFIQLNPKDIPAMICKSYRNILEQHDSLDDLVNDFYVYVLRSKVIENYDPDRGVKFSTYMYSCLHYFLISKYSKHKAHYIDFISLDEDLFDGNDTNLYDLIPVEDDYSGIDILETYKKLKKYETGREKTITHSDLFLKLCAGYTLKELAKEKNVSIQAYHSKKNVLKDILKRKSILGPDFLCSKG